VIDPFPLSLKLAVEGGVMLAEIMEGARKPCRLSQPKVRAAQAGTGCDIGLMSVQRLTIAPVVPGAGSGTGFAQGTPSRKTSGSKLSNSVGIRVSEMAALFGTFGFGSLMRLFRRLQAKYPSAVFCSRIT